MKPEVEVGIRLVICISISNVYSYIRCIEALACAQKPIRLRLRHIALGPFLLTVRPFSYPGPLKYSSLS